MKGEENVLADCLLRLKILGIYEDNNPEQPRHEYGKSIFDSALKTVYNVDTGQNVSQDFKIDGVKYQLEEKDFNDLSLQDT